jgi:TetR/AcrR family transcriptional regulator, transcriptional repressor for nem operon
MPTKAVLKKQTTRDRIVQAADDLFYRRGFENTSFSDIADAMRISRGNFYYHFRSKDEILSAVIHGRLSEAEQMLGRWDTEGAGPTDRIRKFIDILTTNRSLILQHGCPVGTLCTELAKLNHAARPEADKVFTLFRIWLRRQFTLLGRQENADALAMHLLARTQGVAMLASALRDETFVRREVREMHDWLEAHGDCATDPAPRKRKLEGSTAIPSSKTGSSAPRSSNSRHRRRTRA